MSYLCEADVDVQELPAIGWEALLELALETESSQTQFRSMSCQRCAEAEGTALPRSPAVGILAGLLGDNTLANSALFLETAVAEQVEEDEEEVEGKAGMGKEVFSDDEIRS